ncbi:TetR/AcrR family transcriptional regulator [Deinococcus sp.]|uniref:TetR/AcrR family transcriptional regulator n=1 Tax=Deinococcus sp. TaxID=47478 RepID=UPI003CC60491
MKDAVQEQLASARRTQILEAAAQVFASKGFHPSTIRDIARAAGIAEGTIYNYFDNKGALLLGLFDLMSQRARAALTPAAPPADLRGLVRLYLSGPLQALSEGNAELFRVIVSEVMVNPEVRARFYAELLTPMLAAGQEAFRLALPTHDPARLALTMRALSALILGLLLERLMGDATLEDRWDEVPEALAELLIHGLEAEERGGKR